MDREPLRLTLAWLTLLVLLAASLAVTFAPLGAWRFPISMGVAGLKAGVIIWIFMDLRREPGLSRVALLIALPLLVLLVGLTGIDALMRR